MLVLRFCGMAEPLPVLVESSLQIAWDFLGSVGEIADPQQTAEFLLRSIQSQMLRGETRTLMLSNRAIDAHRRRCPLQLVLWSTRVSVCFGLGWVCESHPKRAWPAEQRSRDAFLSQREYRGDHLGHCLVRVLSQL